MFRVLLSTVFFSIAFLGLSSPALAHHPWDTDPETLSLFQGLLSGLAHPVMGLDHFFFLVSIGLVGLLSMKRWLPLLIASGFIGTLLTLISPDLIPGAEVVMGLSLVASAFVSLGVLHPYLMMPLIASHGYVLGQAMIGAEPTPLAGYFLGVLASQSLLIIFGVITCRQFWDNRRVLSGILMGIGLSITFNTLVGFI